jgi:CheY-like chemotaxis protein
MGTLKRILLVEDDIRDIELTLSALNEANLAGDIAIAHDGAEVLDYIYHKGDFASLPDVDPAVILLDLKMPKVNGIQVLKCLKSDENLRRIPVVVLTSSREIRDVNECYQLGANAYVVKPVRFTEFIHVVKEIAIFWTLINEPPLVVG